MANKIYTIKQIETLLRNPYVSSCSDKYMTLTSECRKEALRLREHEYLSPRQIFETL